MTSVESNNGDGLVGIGAFALLSGLSIPRLRHYHDAGLLVPTSVDPSTGYRRYGRDQVGDARTIARLRAVDLPIDELAAVVADRGDGRARAVLLRHRDRLAARSQGVTEMLSALDTILKEESPMTTAPCQLVEVVLRVPDVDAAVAFYRDVFGVEFQPDDHNGAAPTHYDACGGAWMPEGFFMFTLWPAEPGQETKTSLGFGVPDIDAVWERAKVSGARMISEPHDGGYMPKNAVIGDPAGNRINVYQRAGDW